MCEERAADGDTLLLAAGKARGAAAEQVADAEEIDDLRRPCGDVLRRRAPMSIQKVVAHAQMRKQPLLLEDVTQTPPLRWHIGACVAIEQNRVIEHDAAAIGPDQAGEDVDERGLAGAGAAEERGYALARYLQPDIEPELAQPPLRRDVEHRPIP